MPFASSCPDRPVRFFSARRYATFSFTQMPPLTFPDMRGGLAYPMLLPEEHTLNVSETPTVAKKVLFIINRCQTVGRLYRVPPSSIGALRRTQLSWLYGVGTTALRRRPGSPTAPATFTGHGIAPRKKVVMKFKYFYRIGIGSEHHLLYSPVLMQCRITFG